MDYYAGIDVSLKESSICVVDGTGNVVREVKVVSEAEVLIGYFDELELPVSRIGLEAGPLSQWLHAALLAAGRDAVLLETRHVKAALSAMTVKTDRKDARGSLSYCGWAGTVRFTRNRCPARIPGLCLLDASFCKASFSTSN
jgi:transposase